MKRQADEWSRNGCTRDPTLQTDDTFDDGADIKFIFPWKEE